MKTLEDLLRGTQSNSSSTTIALAQRLATQIPADTYLLMKGDLGAGKTTLLKG